MDATMRGKKRKRVQQIIKKINSKIYKLNVNKKNNVNKETRLMRQQHNKQEKTK